MINQVKRSETPAGVGMAIVHQVGSDHQGSPTDAVTPTKLAVVPAVNGHYGAVANVPAAKLTRAGVLAAVAAVNTYLSGLTAQQLDQIHTLLPGGLEVHVTPTQVVCPVPAGGAAALAASLATVLSTGANLTPLPPLN